MSKGLLWLRTLAWPWGWQRWGPRTGLAGLETLTQPPATPPGHSAGHGQPPQGTGEQEDEEEDEEATEEDEEEEEVTLVTRRKRHPALGEGQAIASVIIYRTLAGLLPELYDTDRRSLRCPWGWGARGGSRGAGVAMRCQGAMWHQGGRQVTVP